MKKITLLSGIAILTGLSALLNTVSAQITLDSTDLPHAGLTVVIDSDGTTKPSPGIANISSAQYWDFSGLLRQKSKTDIFMAASATPYASTFTAADLADSTIGGNGYNYFSTSSTNFAVEGAEEIETEDGDVFQIEINLNPVFQQSALPATISLNNINAGVATGYEIFNETLLIFTQERFVTNINYKDTVDAYGTMKMPNDSVYQVLRQKHYELDIDSVYGFTSGTWVFVERIITNKNQYDWYAKGVGYILTQMDMSPTFDTIVDVLWDTNAPAPLPSSIAKLSVNRHVNIYPDPANSYVTFSVTNNTNADRYLTIYDVTGRLVEQDALKNQVFKLNTTTYNNGVYLYSLRDISGSLIDRGRFVVQH